MNSELRPFNHSSIYIYTHIYIYIIFLYVSPHMYDLCVSHNLQLSNLFPLSFPTHSDVFSFEKKDIYWIIEPFCLLLKFGESERRKVREDVGNCQEMPRHVTRCTENKRKCQERKDVSAY